MFLRSLQLVAPKSPQATFISVKPLSQVAQTAQRMLTVTQSKRDQCTGQVSSHAKITNVLTQRYDLPEPEPAILDHIYRESYSLVEEAKQSQLSGGYNVDNWKLAPLGHTQILLQSLAFGTSSLVTLPNHSKNEFDAYLERCKQGLLPLGTSFYFACSVALSHNYIHGNMTLEKGVKHYHEYTQVGQKYCTKTGDVELAHREYVVICQNFPAWMRRIPVATSIVAANPVQKISMDCGKTKTASLGDGQATQLLVAKSLLPFIHDCSKYIFSHHNGLEKSHNVNGQKIGWHNNNQNRHSADLPEIIHVKPNGEHAEPDSSATATKLSR
jgi:hypothetical protein